MTDVYSSDKKDVGIMTFQNTSNFGSFFQTVALYYVLKDMNVNCEIIKYKSAKIENRERLKKPSLDSVRDFVRSLIYRPFFEIRYRLLNSVLEKDTDCSKEYKKNMLCSLEWRYKNIIVGSDLVWSIDVTGGDTTYLLDFFDGTGKYAYASSVGKTINEYEHDIYRKYLSEFRKIGVREEQTREEMVKKFGFKNVYSVCDPTILLYDKWEKYYDYRKSKYYKKLVKQKYLLMYFPDGEGKMRHDAEVICQKEGITGICINSLKFQRGIKNYSVFFPEDFICFIKCASVVLTGSYHGVLFSIFNRTPFFYYIRSHSGRMESLSKRIGIENRSSRFIDNSQSVFYMDFESVYKKMAEYRTDSENFLMEVVSDLKTE